MDRMQTLQGSQPSLRKRRTGDGAAQHAEHAEQLPVLQHPLPSSHISGPEQLRASLVRLGQLEDRELRRPQAQETGLDSVAASNSAGSKGDLHADVQDSCPQGAEQASPAMPAATYSGVSVDSHSSAAGMASEPSYGRPPECDISRLPWAQGRPADPSHAGPLGRGMTDAQKEGRSRSIPGASHGDQLLDAERQTQHALDCSNTAFLEKLSQ